MCFYRYSKNMPYSALAYFWVIYLTGYGEPQLWEVFKNTLLTRLYFFPLEELRLAVETAKRILTNEKNR